MIAKPAWLSSCFLLPLVWLAASAVAQPPERPQPVVPPQGPMANQPIVKNTKPQPSQQRWYVWSHISTHAPDPDRYEAFIVHVRPTEGPDNLRAYIWLYDACEDEASPGTYKLKLAERYLNVELESLDPGRSNRLVNLKASVPLAKMDPCQVQADAPEQAQREQPQREQSGDPEEQEDAEAEESVASGTRTFLITASFLERGNHPGRRAIRVTTFVTRGTYGASRARTECEDYPDDAMLEEEMYAEEYDYATEPDPTLQEYEYQYDGA